MTKHEICAMVVGISGCEYSAQQMSLLQGNSRFARAADEFERQAYAEEDVKELVDALQPEDKVKVAKLMVDEAKLLKEMGQDEAAEAILTTILGLAGALAPTIIEMIKNLSG